MIEINTPESVGMSSSSVNEIDTAMQAFIDQGKLAGISTMIARYGKVVHFECYGKLDIAANKPVQTDSLFRIYSLTKPIIAVAAMMLYDEGHFDLNDPVSKWIPEFKNFKVMQDSTNINSELCDLEKEITFWHLLTHTSGLGYGLSSRSTDPIEEIYRDAKLGYKPHALSILQPTLPELIKKVAKLPLVAQPGTTWHYSLAHDVLGYLIGLISGKPLDVFLRERIFEPLGMQDSSFCVPQEKLKRFGPLYNAPDENGLSVLDNVNNSPFTRPDTVHSGGGGLVSSMKDYLRFMLMLANSGELDGVRLLRLDTVTAMTTNQLTGDIFPIGFYSGPWPGMGWGLGLGVQVKKEPVIGWIGASGTSAWYYPNKEMIVIAMSQAFYSWEACDTFERLAIEAIVT